MLPEDTGGSRNSYENTNLGRVTQNFITTARSFTFSLVQHWSNHTDEIGIYWYVDSDEDDDVEGETTAILGADGVLYFIQRQTIYSSVSGVYKDAAKTQSYTNTYMGDEFQNTPNLTLYADVYEVTIPSNITSWGFYIKHPTAGTKYSESKLNEHVSYLGDHDPCYVATFNYKDPDPNSNNEQQYLCFEDWMGGESNFDMNDLVFSVKGIDPSNIIDFDAITEQAILVCEDLQSYDFDFNDVALGLNYKHEGAKRTYVYNHTTGEYDVTVDESHVSDKLYVTSMAAGGAFESTLTIGGMSWGEIHYLMNEADRFPNETWTAKTHHIINAGAKYGEDGLKTSFDLTSLYANRWNVGNAEGQYATHLSQLFAEDYFQIACTDGNAVTIIANSPNEKSYKENSAPQMMLLPYYFEWPQEEKKITTAYSGFNEWVSDITKTNWIFDTQDKNLVTDRGDFSPEDQQSGSTVDPGDFVGTFNISVQQPATFKYDNKTFNNAIFIPFGDDVLANEGATATIKVTYTYRSKARIYLDAADGTELMKDGSGNHTGPSWAQNEQGFAQAPTVTTTYQLTSSMFKKAYETHGIYLVAQGDERLEVSDVAVLVVTGATDPTTVHDLTVNPTSLTFASAEAQGQDIIASCTTISNISAITFVSSDENVATVSVNGDGTATVTPVAEGTATITVTAPAEGDYGKRTRTVKVTVGGGSGDIIPEGFEEGDQCTNPGWAYQLPNGAGAAIVAANHGKFAVVISEGTAGNTLKLKIQASNEELTTTIVDGQSIYYFDYPNPSSNIKYNGNLIIEGATVFSVWAKAVTE